MKLLSLAVAAALLSAPVVLSAQNPQGPPPPPRPGVMHPGMPPQGMPPGQARGEFRGAMELFDGINLTEAQKQQFRAMRQSEQNVRRGAEGQGGQGAMREPGQMRERVEAIRAILTPEQRVRFDANLNRLRSQMQSRRGAGQPGGQPGAAWNPRPNTSRP